MSPIISSRFFHVGCWWFGPRIYMLFLHVRKSSTFCIAIPIGLVPFHSTFGFYCKLGLRVDAAVTSFENRVANSFYWFCQLTFIFLISFVLWPFYGQLILMPSRVTERTAKVRLLPTIMFCSFLTNNLRISLGWHSLFHLSSCCTGTMTSAHVIRYE